MPTWVVEKMELWIQPVVVEATNETAAVDAVTRYGLGAYGVFAPHMFEAAPRDYGPDEVTSIESAPQYYRTVFDDVRDQLSKLDLTEAQRQLLVADLTLGRALDLKGHA